MQTDEATKDHILSMSKEDQVKWLLARQEDELMRLLFSTVVVTEDKASCKKLDVETLGGKAHTPTVVVVHSDLFPTTK